MPPASDLDAFMATMVAARDAVPVTAAAALAREEYGLEVTVTRLSGERDENFRLTDAHGQLYVLKIASAAEDPVITDLPTAALLHLEHADPGFPCPRVLRSRAGPTQVRYQGRTARILTYLDGKTLRSAQRSAPQRAACGRVAARLGVALRTFTHPAVKRFLIWDLRHIGCVRELGDLPAGVDELIMRIAARIAAEFSHLRLQVIHNDMNDMNLLVDPRDDTAVVGVIDFGDLVHTALIADVAIVAADQIAPDQPARDSITDIVMAYHDITPLLPQELAILNPLIAGRILADVVIASWHRRRNPAGTHYRDLDPAYVRERVELAAELLSSDFTL
jgi:Ser/Thr protein kinase RdoA (MazF antagonist)